MAGTRKIKLTPSYQIVKWKTTQTSRGVKRRQVAVATKTPRAVPNTPTGNGALDDTQEDFNGCYVEPLTLPPSNVSLCSSSHIISN
jgi:hypothetical protein